jgi:hypothetical protein
MDWVQKLFVRCYDEIVDGLKARDDYERLKAAAALRRMLVDEAPLATQANQEHKLKLRFTINRVGDISEIPLKPDLLFHAHGLDPNRFKVRGGTIDVTLEKFLRQPLIELPDAMVSVSDLIKFAANKAGGIHFDKRRNTHESKVDAALSKLSATGLHPLAISLETIETIALTGLKPLRDAIATLPPNLPLVAWYKVKRTGAIYFEGRGQFLETNFKAPVMNGISWNGVLQVMRQAEETRRTIYEIGNDNGEPPKLSIMIDANGDLMASAEVDAHTALVVRAKDFKKSQFFDRSTFVAVDLCYREDGVELSLAINTERVSVDTAVGVFPSRSMNRHTIGSQLDGKQSATFKIRELVLAARCPLKQERDALAEYLWLQWHG